MGGSCGIYARKVLNPDPDILRSITYDEIKRRFIREVIYQSKCSHTNIIQIFLFNQYVENPYFVMEHGQTDLSSEMMTNALSEERKIEIMLMMLQATKRIHDEEYLHRDIKPQNIIKFNDNLYKLSDFGLVKNIDATNDTTAITAIGARMGTTRYMAPEINLESEYTKKTDIYALGILFNDMRIATPSLTPIINKCKQLDKDLRYNSVDDVLNDIGGL